MLDNGTLCNEINGGVTGLHVNCAVLTKDELEGAISSSLSIVDFCCFKTFIKTEDMCQTQVLR